jgi:ketosteroid isomerase-like protein
MSKTTSALVQRYWDLANARDWQGFGRLVSSDVVYEAPQTRERVRGREAYVDFNSTWPGEWHVQVEHIVAEASKAVSVITFVVEGESMTGISVFELQGDAITRITDYWPSAYEPPSRKASHIERY